MKPSKQRKKVQELYRATKTYHADNPMETHPPACAVVCRVARDKHGIDTRTALRALGGTSRGIQVQAESSDGRGARGTVWDMPDGSVLLNTPTGEVYDITQCRVE